MKIGIHHSKGGFSDRWIRYCEENNVLFKIVNCYATDIIQQLDDCDALMWHHQHTNYKDVLLAKNLLFSLEQSGKVVFPDFNTGWHFDDKVAQKYLLESINAPLVPSYAFYDKKTALAWISETQFPKVFKLKGGSGSKNVKLVLTESKAKRLIKKSFGKGFSQSDSWGNLKERYRKFKVGKESLQYFINGIARLIIPTEYSRMHGREKGYAYFQDFIPNLDSDIRIQIIGNRVFGLKRYVRENDFRASGSGNFTEFNNTNIDKKLLKLAFEVNKKIKSQCLTIDFIYNNNTPIIVELSYGFPVQFYDNCPGYWDENLIWHEGLFNPQAWMVEDIINKEDK